MINAQFDPEDLVWQYRFAHHRGDRPQMQQLRKQWLRFDGGDDLHAMTYGGPIDPAAFADRLKRIKRELSLVANRKEALEAELAWLERRASKSDDC